MRPDNETFWQGKPPLQDIVEQVLKGLAQIGSVTWQEDGRTFRFPLCSPAALDMLKETGVTDFLAHLIQRFAFPDTPEWRLLFGNRAGGPTRAEARRLQERHPRFLAYVSELALVACREEISALSHIRHQSELTPDQRAKVDDALSYWRGLESRHTESVKRDGAAETTGARGPLTRSLPIPETLLRYQRIAAIPEDRVKDATTGTARRRLVNDAITASGLKKASPTRLARLVDEIWSKQADDGDGGGPKHPKSFAVAVLAANGGVSRRWVREVLKRYGTVTNIAHE